MNKKQSNKIDQVYNATDLILFAWKKKTLLIIISLVAFISSILISLNIEEKFNSHVVLFPAASISISKSLVETSGFSDKRDILSFGEDEDVERILQILRSDKIRGYVIERHKLMEHYEIEPDQKYRYTMLNNMYKGNVKTRRTQYNSIEISVMDKDPQKAADMVNDIAVYIDSILHFMQKERALEAYKIVEREFHAAEQTIADINVRAKKIRELGVIDYESQATALNEAYAIALAEGNNAAVNRINNRLKVLAKYGGEYVSLSMQLEYELDRLSQLRDKYIGAKVNMEQTLSQVFIVDRGEIAEKKSYPKKLRIVMFSTVSTFALSLLLLLILNNFRKSS